MPVCKGQMIIVGGGNPTQNGTALTPKTIGIIEAEHGEKLTIDMIEGMTYDKVYSLNATAFGAGTRYDSVDKFPSKNLGLSFYLDFKLKKITYSMPACAGLAQILSIFEWKATVSPRGDKGDKGDAGADGKDGLKGDTGKTGVKGSTGEKGSNGTDGVDGKNGTDGKDGATGAIGNGISKIEKTATTGLIDEYTITYTDKTTFKYEVTNGKDGGGGASDHKVILDKNDVNPDFLSSKLLAGENVKIQKVDSRLKISTTSTSAVTSVNEKTGDVVLGKKDIGLELADNTADADKPISTSTKAELDRKQIKISGKSLSTNDLTNELKTNYDDANAKKHEHANKDALDVVIKTGDGAKSLRDDGTYKADSAESWDGNVDLDKSENIHFLNVTTGEDKKAYPLNPDNFQQVMGKTAFSDNTLIIPGGERCRVDLIEPDLPSLETEITVLMQFGTQFGEPLPVDFIHVNKTKIQPNTPIKITTSREIGIHFGNPSNVCVDTVIVSRFEVIKGIKKENIDLIDVKENRISKKLLPDVVVERLGIDVNPIVEINEITRSESLTVISNKRENSTAKGKRDVCTEKFKYLSSLTPDRSIFDPTDKKKGFIVQFEITRVSFDQPAFQFRMLYSIGKSPLTESDISKMTEVHFGDFKPVVGLEERLFGAGDVDFTSGEKIFFYSITRSWINHELFGDTTGGYSAKFKAYVNSRRLKEVNLFDDHEFDRDRTINKNILDNKKADYPSLVEDNDFNEGAILGATNGTTILWSTDKPPVILEKDGAEYDNGYGDYTDATKTALVFEFYCTISHEYILRGVKFPCAVAGLKLNIEAEFINNKRKLRIDMTEHTTTEGLNVVTFNKYAHIPYNTEIKFTAFFDKAVELTGEIKTNPIDTSKTMFVPTFQNMMTDLKQSKIMTSANFEALESRIRALESKP